MTSALDAVHCALALQEDMPRDATNATDLKHAKASTVEISRIPPGLIMERRSRRQAFWGRDQYYRFSKAHRR